MNPINTVRNLHEEFVVSIVCYERGYLLGASSEFQNEAGKVGYWYSRVEIRIELLRHLASTK